MNYAVQGDSVPVISRLKLLSFAAIAGLVLCAAAPAGQAPSLRMHQAPQAPTPSTLPPPHLVGDPGTRLLRRYSGTPIDVTTYHYDGSRTGWNQAETDLTPATVGSSSFGLLDTLTVDGNVFAEPLLVSNFVFPDGAKHDVLIVATGHDSVYAFDAQTYQVLWQVSLGTSQGSYDVGCYDVKPEYGISSTPIIWRTGPGSATLFVVAATEPSHGVFVSELHALNLANGKDRVTPTVISPSATLNDGSTVTFDPRNQWSRAGLVFANGSIYVSIGSHCDNNSGNTTGWLLRYSTQLAPMSAFHTVNTHGGLELASIWMAGFAPAVDSKGDIFVATGNGDYTKNQADWGESVLKLTQKLSSVETAFTATQYSNYNHNDTDLGSGGVMLLPIAGQTPPLAVQTGKAGILYLLNQTALGGLRKDDRGALQQIDTGHGVWGGPAYYNGPAGPTIYTQGTSGFLQSWSVKTGGTPSLTAGVKGTSAGGYGGSMPIISSNGATAGTGVVWLINRANEPFSIEAYDAVNLGAPLFSAQIGTWSNTAQGNPFLTPLEANGRVYAPGYKVVQVYGLTP
jgi:hypothetical protein